VPRAGGPPDPYEEEDPGVVQLSLGSGAGIAEEGLEVTSLIISLPSSLHKKLLKVVSNEK
jgi:hypothetical protein